jgi:hypothetical protein
MSLTDLLRRDHAFVHATAYDDGGRPTKLEVAALIHRNALPTVYANMDALDSIPLSAIYANPNRYRAQHLLLLEQKPSCDRYTEGTKKFLEYPSRSRGCYLTRPYMTVGEDYFKLEVTKALLGQRDYLYPRQTVEGSLKLLSRLCRDVEASLLPHWMHGDDFQTIDEFYKNL